MTKTIADLTVNLHGEAAVELANNWHADTMINVTDDRLSGEDFTCTVSDLLNLLLLNDWNIHGYTVCDRFVRGQDGTIKIEVAE